MLKKIKKSIKTTIENKYDCFLMKTKILFIASFFAVAPFFAITPFFAIAFFFAIASFFALASFFAIASFLAIAPFFAIYVLNNNAKESRKISIKYIKNIDNSRYID